MKFFGKVWTFKAFTGLPIIIFGLAFLALMVAPVKAQETGTIEPLQFKGYQSKANAIATKLDMSVYQALKSEAPSRIILFPIASDKSLVLELERFDVMSPRARIKRGLPGGGDIDMPRPDVVMFRGKISGEPASHAFLAFTGQGSGNGYVYTNGGELYIMSQAPTEIGKADGGTIVIHKKVIFGDAPDYEEFCKVIFPEDFHFDYGKALVFTDTVGGPRVAEVAIDAEQKFCDIFPDTYAAQNYIAQLFGAISDIYVRDLDIKLMITFLRLWPDGGEPFDTDGDVGDFRNWWWSHEDTTGLNVIHLLNGKKNLGAGGLGYVGGTCWWGAYSTSMYLNGYFPLPEDIPNAGNWDITVIAHEIGHNFYGMHTHDDWFYPHIDECGNGTYSRGTIMSYCHTTNGYTSNLNLHFHRRNQDFMEEHIIDGNCYWFDCNNNGADDARDISLGISQDTNANGIPDECEDCNSNGILDDLDIAGGMPDINGNGIPDVCEDDCNGNSIPDEYETRTERAEDLNGNCIPDECDPDCNNNGVADFYEISVGMQADVDNNNIPDTCQDCDGNGISDWLDLGREFNLFILDNGNFIREYNTSCGMPIRSVAVGEVPVSTDCVFGPDRQLYVSSSSGIFRVDVDVDTTSLFIPAGSGGLGTAMALVFGPDDDLYACEFSKHCILRFDGQTGAFIDTFVTPNLGGLTAPYAIDFGPTGDLFIASGTGSVIRYSGIDGSLIGTFIAPGSGGLASPRGLAFGGDANLLVVSYGTSQILMYDGSTGEFIKVFSDEYEPMVPSSIRIGPSGNAYVLQIGGINEVYEYFYPDGRYYRRYVRAPEGLIQPMAIAFRPKAASDLDGNYILDVCDNCVDTDGDGFGNPGHPSNTCLTDNCPDIYNTDQMDIDNDGIGDVCDVCPFDPYDDIDGDGICGDADNCPTIPNALQEDSDLDGIGDLCDNCPGDANEHQDDIDEDFVGDPCDNCPDLPNTDQANDDADTLGNVCDNCPEVENDDQSDIDSDGYGDLCDNCPENYNPDQTDSNGNGVGDACDYVCGDASGDQTVNILDITYLINYLYKGGPPPDRMEAADADGNGVVNLLDITYLISYLYKGGPAPICEQGE